MSKVIDIKSININKEDLEETKVDELFDSIIEKNRAIKEKVAQERAQHNKKVLKAYRMKG